VGFAKAGAARSAMEAKKVEVRASLRRIGMGILRGFRSVLAYSFQLPTCQETGEPSFGQRFTVAVSPPERVVTARGPGTTQRARPWPNVAVSYFPNSTQLTSPRTPFFREIRRKVWVSRLLWSLVQIVHEGPGK
jgi:hypothetical protein